MPEDLWEADSENDVSVELTLNDGSPIDRPTALECGQAENKRVQPVRWGTESLKSVKWYRYTGTMKIRFLIIGFLCCHQNIDSTKN